MIGGLPESLTVSGQEYEIRTDYRNALQVYEMFADPELDGHCRTIKAIHLLFYNFETVDDVYEAINNGFDAEEAIKQIAWYLTGGNPRENREELPVYDWIQDEQMIFSAVNKVAGTEVRELDYMHWWTFLGYFGEIGEGVFSYTVHIRRKLNNGKKLDESEKEFLSKNKDMVAIKKHLTEEEQKEEDEYQALIKDVLG